MELQIIQHKIFEVRGQRVILDIHLAELYQVENRALKQAVRRNIERFPSDFMFQLTKDEANTLLNIGVSQNVISPQYNFGIALPMAFTEQGVSMLSSVLRSKTAVEINISIMRAFVAMRQYLTSTAVVTAELSEMRTRLQLLERGGEETLGAVNDLSEDVYKEIGTIYEAIAALSLKPAPAPRRPMGYRFEPKDE